MERRSKFWIMPDVQKGYILNIAIFWFSSLIISILSFLLSILALQNKGLELSDLILTIWDQYLIKSGIILIFMGIHLAISLLFGYYFLRIFTLRICGPIYNVQRSLNKINTEPDSVFTEIRIREKDYFRPMVNELNQILRKGGFIKNNPDQRGFSLVEALVALGLIGVITSVVAGLFSNTMQTQRGIQAKDRQREISAEVRTLLVDKTACLTSFTGQNPQAGFNVQSIKDGLGVERFKVGRPDRSGLLQFTAFRVENWQQDVTAANQGVADLLISLSKVGNVASVRDIKPEIIAVRFKLDTSNQIMECYSIGTLTDGFWQATPSNISDIFYSSGKVSVGMNDPQFLFNVGNPAHGHSFGVTPDGDIHVNGGHDSKWALFKRNPANVTTPIMTVEPDNSLILLAPSVGVGMAPQAKLDVDGSIRPGSSGVSVGGACAPEGALAYDANVHAPVYCHQSGNWAVMGGGLVTFKTGPSSVGGTSIATCPAGEKLVSGGCNAIDRCGGNDSSLYGGYPDPSSNSWICPGWHCNTTTAYAGCMM